MRMKQRTLLTYMVLVNLLLIALLAAIVIREGYAGKIVAVVTGRQTPFTQSVHYRRAVQMQRQPVSQAMAGSDVLIAFTGDSIIESWLTSARVPRSMNLGISGDTIAGLVARADPEVIDHIPAWYIGIGVNDALKGRSMEAIAASVARLAASYGRAQTLYWSAVLPVAGDRWNDEKEAFRRSLNAHIRKACLEMENCTFLDVPEGYTENFPAWSSDGVHPNAEGYLALTRQICRHVTCSPERP